MCLLRKSVNQSTHFAGKQARLAKKSLFIFSFNLENEFKLVAGRHRKFVLSESTILENTFKVFFDLS
jgi:hypothetical protein